MLPSASSSTKRRRFVVLFVAVLLCAVMGLVVSTPLNLNNFKQQQQQAPAESSTASSATVHEDQGRSTIKNSDGVARSSPPSLLQPPPTDDGHPEFKDFVVLGETIRMPRERRWEHLLPKENVPEYRMPTNAPSMTCEGQGLRRRAANAPPLTRKIFYVNTYNNETTQLHMKLDEIYPVVDYIVLVEGKRTFQFQPKPIYFSFDDPQFAKYHKKIIHHVYDFPASSGGAWDIEHKARREGYVAVQHLIREGDLFLSADVDEIVRREALQLLHDCDLGEQQQKVGGVVEGGGPTTPLFPLAFSLTLFEYGFRWAGGPWRTPVVVRFNPADVSPVSGRPGLSSPVAVTIANAGWHLSWMFSVSGIQHKLNTFSHSEYNRPPYTDANYLKEMVCSGRMFWSKEQLTDVVVQVRPRVEGGGGGGGGGRGRRSRQEAYDVLHYVWRNEQELSWLLPEGRHVDC